MRLSIHYNVLSLSDKMSRLYEGFRDKLIDIDNGKFPLEISNLDNPGSTLFIEEEYHVRGSIRMGDQSLVISKNVDIWDVIDDVVDTIIEKVLKLGGTIIFMNDGSLTKLGRIALIRG